MFDLRRKVRTIARKPLVLVAVAAACAIPSRVDAQLQIATLSGIVLDVGGAPVAGAAVVLQDAGGSVTRAAITGSNGSFVMRDVAPGSYLLRAELGGSLLVSRPLVVRGSLPIEVLLHAGAAFGENVVVSGDADSNAPEHSWSLSGDRVRNTPEPLPSHAVQGALAALPGWTMEDNGLLHVRGVDDGLLYVRDGIPIYERLDRLFGLPPNASAISSLHVRDGYIPPEFGFKSGGVIEVRSESGMGRRWFGAVDAGMGTFTSRFVSAVAAGPVGEPGGVMLTATDERSSRFLDPVHPDNLHNDGRSTAAEAQFTWRSGAHLFTTSLSAGRSRYDVPHNAEQEEAGQDQQQRTAQVLTSGTWQHALTDRTVWQVSAYLRHSDASLYRSAADTPVTTHADRTSNRQGLLWSATHQAGRHTLKAGGELSRLLLDEEFSFAVTDPEAAEGAGLSDSAIAHDAGTPFVFSDRRRPWLWSMFAQDAVAVMDRLTVNFGVRFDGSRLLVRASQWSPRIGAAYEVAEGTALRASFMRLFQPPQAEYLLLASSPEARALSPFVDDGGGGASIPPERQSAFEVSLAHALRSGWRLHGSAWRRRGRDVDDPNVFFGTTVTFPNSVARQHAAGFEARLDMPPRGRLSGSAAYSHARIAQFGPITGGLFLEDDYLEIQDGSRFTPDHDQRHAFHATATYADLRRNWRVSAMFRYQTGTPMELEIEEGEQDGESEDLRERPGVEVADFAAGRVRPRAVADLQATWSFHRGRRAELTAVFYVNNLFDDFYAFNFGNPFSGTHFGSPRRAGLTIRATFGSSMP
jgi:outer membrane receptor protein involved in Fe transport